MDVSVEDRTQEPHSIERLRVATTQQLARQRQQALAQEFVDFVC